MFKEFVGFAVWSEKVKVVRNKHETITRYTAYFQFVNEDFTKVDLVGEAKFKKGCRVNPFETLSVQAFTKRNPKDAYNSRAAMKEVMRKACGIGETDAPLLLDHVYSAFRYFLRRQQPDDPVVVGVDMAEEDGDMTIIQEFYGDANG